MLTLSVPRPLCNDDGETIINNSTVNRSRYASFTDYLNIISIARAPRRKPVLLGSRTRNFQCQFSVQCHHSLSCHPFPSSFFCATCAPYSYIERAVYVWRTISYGKTNAYRIDCARRFAEIFGNLPPYIGIISRTYSNAVHNVTQQLVVSVTAVLSKKRKENNRIEKINKYLFYSQRVCIHYVHVRIVTLFTITLIRTSEHDVICSTDDNLPVRNARTLSKSLFESSLEFVYRY
jgi:hypothetical protein